jgi:hypothetical protein
VDDGSDFCGTSTQLNVTNQRPPASRVRCMVFGVPSSGRCCRNFTFPSSGTCTRLPPPQIGNLPLRSSINKVSQRCAPRKRGYPGF